MTQTDHTDPKTRRNTAKAEIAAFATGAIVTCVGLVITFFHVHRAEHYERRPDGRMVPRLGRRTLLHRLPLRKDLRRHDTRRRRSQVP